MDVQSDKTSVSELDEIGLFPVVRFSLAIGVGCYGGPSRTVGRNLQRIPCGIIKGPIDDNSVDGCDFSKIQGAELRHRLTEGPTCGS